MTDRHFSDSDVLALGLKSPPAVPPIAVAVARRSWSLPHLPLVLAPLAGALMLSLTFLYWQSEERSISRQRELSFETSADRVAQHLRERMDSYELVLSGIKGYVEGSDHITTQEFSAYVRAMSLPAFRPGLRGVAMLSMVPAAERAAHEERMHQLGMADYRVHSGDEGPPQRLDLESAQVAGPAYVVPITHIESFRSGERPRLGYDASLDVSARDAMNRARDSGHAALSGLMTLTQESGKAVGGLVMYKPLYAPQSDESTLQGRRAGLQGWVSASFVLDDVMASLQDRVEPGMQIEIFDDAGGVLGSRLYSSPLPDGSQGVQLEPRLMRSDSVPGTVQHRRLSLGARDWNVQMTLQPPAFDPWRHDGHYVVALIGCLLSALLAWLTWQLATARTRAIALAQGMTAQLRHTRDDLESTLNAIPDLLLEVGLDGMVHHHRGARADLAPTQLPSYVGRRLSDVVDGRDAEVCRAALQRAHEVGYSSGSQYRQTFDGQQHWFELSIARKDSEHGGEPARFIALARDITERKRAEARTHQLAFFDALTGLPNRRMLLNKIQEVLSAAHQSGAIGALFYIDLDNFKQINDARGHGMGDLLLEQVAQRIARLQRTGDTVARLGGDEFVVLVHPLSNDRDDALRRAQALAEGLRLALDAPYNIGGHVYSLTGSIGATLFPKQGERVDDLLREADTAMYRAKDLGRNRICFYESTMQLNVQERLSLEQDLQRAHGLGQLSAFVQSQVDANGVVVGGELLMRWHHPERGNVPPDRFIPVAESSGLILRLGDWMIAQACETLALLQAQGRRLSMSVNVSERQFRQDDFVERVRQVLQRTGANPSDLVLEVTESLLIEDLEDTIARMAEIEQIGVRFSIDDFGTGYSSLAYLKRLPLYELKIDRSFIKDTPTDASDMAIVQAIISVARHLNLQVVAEGVETQAQADFLAQSRCDFLQGYLFSRPEPLPQWLERQLSQEDVVSA